jgi:hypothetical protein
MPAMTNYHPFLAVGASKQANARLDWFRRSISLANWASNIMIIKGVCIHLTRPPSPFTRSITIAILNLDQRLVESLKYGPKLAINHI